MQPHKKKKLNIAPKLVMKFLCKSHQIKKEIVHQETEFESNHKEEETLRYSD